MIKAAVIGVGAMGANHARVYADLPQVKLVAVVDSERKVAENVGLKYGAEPFDNIMEMLERKKPEVVSVAVPTAMHEEVTSIVLEAGAHALVEKPIASTLEQGQRLIDLATQHKRKLMVGHIVRFNPAIRALRQKLANNELGRIFQIVCRRVGPFPARIRDVGVVIDLAPHDIDIMRFLTGTEPLRLYAEIERRLHTDHEDLLFALLNFPDHVTGALEINWLTPTKVREILVLGERGMFQVNDLTQDLYFFENAESDSELWSGLRTIKGVSEGRMVRFPLNREEPLRAEIKAFIASVLEGKDVPVTGQDGLAALRIALALIESGKGNQVVHL